MYFLLLFIYCLFLCVFQFERFLSTSEHDRTFSFSPSVLKISCFSFFSMKNQIRNLTTLSLAEQAKEMGIGSVGKGSLLEFILERLKSFFLERLTSWRRCELILSENLISMKWLRITSNIIYIGVTYLISIEKCRFRFNIVAIRWQCWTSNGGTFDVNCFE